MGLSPVATGLSPEKTGTSPVMRKRRPISIRQWRSATDQRDGRGGMLLTSWMQIYTKAGNGQKKKQEKVERRGRRMRPLSGRRRNAANIAARNAVYDKPAAQMRQ